MIELGQGRTPRVFGWVLWIALAAAWFATMPWRPLLDPDEGRYAEIPREMVARGDWVTPRLNDLKYFEKPPLQYWATAAAYSVFGFSEWTARLWTVALGFLCLPMVLAWTARLYGARAGLGAFLVLAVSPYFELIGHLNLLDAGFSFWVAGSVFAFCLAQTSPVGSKAARGWMWTAWAAAALAVLSKGIVVGVLIGATLILYMLIERDWRLWRRLHLLTGGPLFLAIAAPWFIWVSVRNPSFAQFFFIHEHFARFLTTVHQRVEPWWYFGALLLIGALPWLAVLPGACREAWRGEGEVTAGSVFKPLKFLLIFSIVTVVFFSASSSKLAPYVLPMMPPLAALVGVFVAGRPRFLQRVAQFSGWLLLALAGGFVLYARHRFGFLPAGATRWLALAALVASVGMLVTRVSSAWQAPRAAWLAAASAMLGWQLLLSAFTELPDRTGYTMLKTVKPLIGTETELFSVGQYRQTLSAYLQRTLRLVQFEGELAFGLGEEPGARLTQEAFLAHWQAATNAVVFVDPSVYNQWRQEGMPGRVIGGDNVTLAVSRQ